MRLHRYIAQCGVCSRRKAEELIVDGRVTVNGEIVTTLGTKIEEGDEVRVDGRPIEPERLIYLAMYKPKGVVTTMADERGRRTVSHLLPRLPSVVKPVGRLDKDTDGLLLFTNDGELARRLTHPSHGTEKEYEATVQGEPDDRAVEKLRTGVRIEGRKTRPARVDRIGRNKLRLVLKEGWKRQVRVMCEAVGHPVVELRRVRFGPIRLGTMKPGESRPLTQSEVDKLQSE